MSWDDIIGDNVAAANIVWPIEPPETSIKDTTKDKNGSGNNKK